MIKGERLAVDQDMVVDDSGDQPEAPAEKPPMFGGFNCEKWCTTPGGDKICYTEQKVCDTLVFRDCSPVAGYCAGPAESFFAKRCGRCPEQSECCFRYTTKR